MNTFSVTTAYKRQIIDITDTVEGILPTGSGVITVFIRHTTAAITTADLDPGTDLDMLDFLQRITPAGPWRHPHDPDHVPDHILASIIGPSVAVPYADGRLMLGTWQRVILVELDGPRERTVVVTA